METDTRKGGNDPVPNIHSTMCFLNTRMRGDPGRDGGA